MNRVYLDKQSPTVYKALTATAGEIRARAAEVGISRVLLELVNIRVSQLNQCAYCLDLHTRQAVEAGETAQRLALLPAWRETTLFTEQERAALEIAESLTEGPHLGDAEYQRLAQRLSPDEISLISWAAIAINAFNGLSIMSGHPVRRR